MVIWHKDANTSNELDCEMTTIIIFSKKIETIWPSARKQSAYKKNVFKHYAMSAIIK